jgi:hypothetical protein
LEKNLAEQGVQIPIEEEEEALGGRRADFDARNLIWPQRIAYKVEIKGQVNNFFRERCLIDPETGKIFPEKKLDFHFGDPVYPDTDLDDFANSTNFADWNFFDAPELALQAPPENRPEQSRLSDGDQEERLDDARSQADIGFGFLDEAQVPLDPEELVAAPLRTLDIHSAFSKQSQTTVKPNQLPQPFYNLPKSQRINSHSISVADGSARGLDEFDFPDDWASALNSNMRQAGDHSSKKNGSRNGQTHSHPSDDSQNPFGSLPDPHAPASSRRNDDVLRPPSPMKKIGRDVLGPFPRPERTFRFP